MPVRSGFSFIEQYRTLSKDLEFQTCPDIMPLDQEVRSCLEEGEIKMEVLDTPRSTFSTLMDSFLDNNSNSSSSCGNHINGVTKSPVSLSRSNNNIIPASGVHNSLCQQSDLSAPFSDNYLSTAVLSLSPSSSSSSSFSSSFASSETAVSDSSPMGINFLYNPNSLSDTTSVCGTTTTTNTYVKEHLGSGCVVKTSSQHTDFLTGSSSSSSSDIFQKSALDFLSDNVTPPSMCVPEETMDLLDLDRQPISFYDDFKDVKPVVSTDRLKLEPVTLPEESVMLEEAVVLMRDVIHHDCDKLKVPYDPTHWSPEHVHTWVSWVCQKNQVPDVSSQIYPCDGRTLCSMRSETFTSRYRESGVSISNELELWKATNTCFPDQMYLANNSQTGNCSSAQPRPHLSHHSEQSNSFQLTPCVSPAPSSCSNGQDSSHLSDPSDEEGSQGYMPSRTPPTSSNFPHSSIKIGGSRGHKQTIHLWQFLRELLLSKEGHSDCIRWLDRKSGVFKIEDSKKVAQLWGARKNRPAMNYDKLSRSVRQYYKKGIIKKTEQSKRLVYQFCAGYL